ncbi:MAG TPA: NADH-quinone oxidoreductase subunit C [Thermoplasmata archaeon]|jgi:NADH-quinone oxidoreductase subunit C|nr:NADH-quinone oxidoreductase subunit C [Thermoplasmata archaeon]
MAGEGEVLTSLKDRFGGALLSLELVRPRLLKLTLDRKDLVPVCAFLKEKLGFAHVSCITAVDWRDHYESVYHLTSWSRNLMVQINATIPHDDPRIDSITPLWPAANVHEREAYDLMGLVFEGHPNLTRILLPKDFAFFPLRKDFPQEVDRQYVSRRKIGGGA